PGGTPDSTRLDELKQTLTSSGLATELERRFKVSWFAFDGNARPLDSSAWPTLEPTGATTRYADSLATAWNYPRPDSPADGSAPQVPERVLLVSDGLDRGTPDIVEIAQRLGVPIDVLAPGTLPLGLRPSQVAIADVQGARRVLLGSETHF